MTSNKENINIDPKFPNKIRRRSEVRIHYDKETKNWLVVFSVDATGYKCYCHKLEIHTKNLELYADSYPIFNEDGSIIICKSDCGYVNVYGEEFIKLKKNNTKVYHVDQLTIH